MARPGIDPRMCGSAADPVLQGAHLPDLLGSPFRSCPVRPTAVPDCGRRAGESLE